MTVGGAHTVLGDLSEELGRLHSLLADYVEKEALSGGAGIGIPDVEALIAARHARSAAIGLNLVNPGWSLLLELKLAHLKGKPIRMPRLATEARVSMTTMFRWLDRFYAIGLAERLPHPVAERGILVRLTPAGAEAIRYHFASVKPGRIIG
jgi:DNA-binding MarR family transcriptional regulator